MHWFIDPVSKHYVDFKGRTARQPFWMFNLLYIVFSSVLSLLLGEISLIFDLAVLLPGIAITTRRLHDTGRSGWWQLLVLFPVIGWIVLLVFLVMDTTPADNQYGPNPKATGATPSIQSPAQPAQ